MNTVEARQAVNTFYLTSHNLEILAQHYEREQEYDMVVMCRAAGAGDQAQVDRVAYEIKIRPVKLDIDLLLELM